ncbi:MAG TPA: hypothetical protein DCM40_04155 [Maribacter sp.]|nr:hypothetical protein [Maribacter sp.]
MNRGPIERQRQGRVKAVSREGMSNSKYRALGNDGTKTGVENEKINEPHPNYNVAPCEKVFEGENNQFIILGRDRPAGRTSGYGGAGDTHCARIELVAGMSGMLAKEVNVKNQTLEKFQYDDPNDNEETIFTDGNAFADASKIYMSQRTDVDRNFKLSVSRIGNYSTRSAVAVKADAVRIISRDAGIKLIAGGTDSLNSQGKKIIGKDRIGIALNCGNVPDSDMYKLVKGEPLVELLKGLYKNVSELNSAVGQIAQALIAVGGNLAAIPFTAPAGAASAAGGTLATLTATTQQANLAISEIDLELQKILSQYNYTN